MKRPMSADNSGQCERLVLRGLWSLCRPAPAAAGAMDVRPLWSPPCWPPPSYG